MSPRAAVTGSDCVQGCCSTAWDAGGATGLLNTCDAGGTTRVDTRGEATAVRIGTTEDPTTETGRAAVSLLLENSSPRATEDLASPLVVAGPEAESANLLMLMWCHTVQQSSLLVVVVAGPEAT